MDPTIRVIAALLNILKSENVEFTGLNAQGTVNVATILTQAEAFVKKAVEAEEAAEDGESNE